MIWPQIEKNDNKYNSIMKHSSKWDSAPWIFGIRFLIVFLSVFQVFVSTGSSTFRKPGLGMLHFLEDKVRILHWQEDLRQIKPKQIYVKLYVSRECYQYLIQQ